MAKSLFPWFGGKKPAANSPPWEHRRWRGGLARHHVGLATVFHFFMASLFLGVGIGMLIGIPRATLTKEWVPLAFIAMFLLVGFGILIGALISLARWLRFRRCQVRLQTLPGVIGGHFAGEIDLPGSFPNDADVRLELLCESTVFYPGKGNQDSSTSISTAWSHKVCIRPSVRRQGGHQGSVPFDFIIPYGQHDETDEDKSAETGITTSYKWYLQVTAVLPGADLDIKFRVPVFKTAASDRSLTKVPEAGADLPLEKYLEEQGEKQRIRIESSHGSPVYVGSVTPIIWQSVLPLSIISTILLGIGIGMLVFAVTSVMTNRDLHMPQGVGEALFMLLPLAFSIIPFIIGVVFFGFGALLFPLAIREFVSRRTWIANGNVCQSRRFLGIPLPARSVPCSQVDSVAVGGSSSNGGKSFRDVTIAFRKNGKPPARSLLKTVFGLATITVATSIPTRRETDEIINAIRRHINQHRQTPITDEPDDEPAVEESGPDK